MNGPSYVGPIVIPETVGFRSIGLMEWWTWFVSSQQMEYRLG